MTKFRFQLLFALVLTWEATATTATCNPTTHLAESKYPCKSVDVNAVISATELTSIGGHVPPGSGYTIFSENGQPSTMCQLCDTDMPTPTTACFQAALGFSLDPRACKAMYDPKSSCKVHNNCTDVHEFCESCGPIATCLAANNFNVLKCGLPPPACVEDFKQVCNSGDVGSDVWGYSAQGRDFALVCLAHSTAFVDVTEPAKPINLGYLPTPANAKPSSWCDIKVIGSTMYKVSEASGHGLQEFDLTTLTATNPKLANFKPQKFTASKESVDKYSTHNLVTNEQSGLLFGTGSSLLIAKKSCGLIAYDATFSGGAQCLLPGALIHDAECVTYAGPDSKYTQQEICILFRTDSKRQGISVYSMTLKAAECKTNSSACAHEISHVTYTNMNYPHQGWLSADHRYLVINDEGDENAGSNTTSYVFDLESLSSPKQLSSFEQPFANTDHNLYFYKNQIYQSDGDRGLRVFDFNPSPQTKSSPLTEVAYLEVTADQSNPRRSWGAWSTFQFPSKADNGVAKVVMNTKKFGFFVLTVTKPAATTTAKVTTKPTSGATAKVTTIKVSNVCGTIPKAPAAADCSVAELTKFGCCPSISTLVLACTAIAEVTKDVTCDDLPTEATAQYCGGNAVKLAKCAMNQATTQKALAIAGKCTEIAATACKASPVADASTTEKSAASTTEKPTEKTTKKPTDTLSAACMASSVVAMIMSAATAVLML